jgi:hypothetical protein
MKFWKNKMNLKLRKIPCKDCPFYESGVPLTPDYMASVIDYLSEGVNHICHTTNAHVCHGGRELQLQIFTAQGKIKAPTNESLFEPNFVYED